MTSDRFSSEKDEMLIELVSRHPMLWNMANKEWKNQLKKDLAWIEIGRQMEKTSSQCKLRWKSIRDHYRKQRKQENSMPTGSAAAKKKAAYWDRLQFLDTMEDERRTFSNANTQDVETPAVNVEDPDDPPESQQLDNSTQPPLSQSSEAVSPPPPSSQTLPAISPSEGSDTFRKPPVKKAKTSKEKSILRELVVERSHDRAHLQTYLDKIMENEPEDENDLFFKTMARTVKKFKPALITQAKKRIFSIVMDLEEENQQTSNIYGGNFPPRNYPGDGYYKDSAPSSVQSSSSSSSSLVSTPIQQYPIDEPPNVLSTDLQMSLSDGNCEY